MILLSAALKEIAMNDSSSLFLSDSSKIFEPKPTFSYVRKFIYACAPDKRAFKITYYDYHNCAWHKEYFPIDSPENIKQFKKYITQNSGTLYVQMLLAVEQCPCSYHDIFSRILKPRGLVFGNDTELWNSLRDNDLVELSHKGKYGRKFYKLTTLGQEVLYNVKQNFVAYRVLRHFMKFKDSLDIPQLVSIQINPQTMDDLEPKTVIEMLEAIFNDSSHLHEIGSHFYWCNKLVECIRKYVTFVDVFNCSEVKAWLEANSSNSHVEKFLKIFKKTLKKMGYAHEDLKQAQ